MGLDKIVSKILADSKSREQSIVSGAQKEGKELLAEARKKKSEIIDAYQEKADQAIEDMKAREKAGMEIEVKKNMLSVRREILEEAFDSVLEHFLNLPDNEKRVIYSATISRLQGEFQQGRIHCRRGEENFFSGIPNFTVAEPVDTIGGFIAENTDGSLIIDMRFETLLKEIWDHHLVEISGILFRDEELP